MLLEDPRRLVCSVLAQSVFIDNLMAIALAGESLKDRGGDPSDSISVTEDRMTIAHTYGSRTSHPPILTPRTFSEPQSNWTLRFESGELSEWSVFRHTDRQTVSCRVRSTYAVAAAAARSTANAAVTFIVAMTVESDGEAGQEQSDTRAGRNQLPCPEYIRGRKLAGRMCRRRQMTPVGGLT